MHKSRVLRLCLAALAMGIASPFIANLGPGYTAAPETRDLFQSWFYALPTVVDQWLWPEGQIPMLLLAMAVLTVQYLALFAVIVGLTELARVTKNYISS